MIVEHGRRRSKEATIAILQAALELALERGINFATVERISERSGIAKSTIYRRWPNAESIVLNAFLEDISPLIEYQKEGSIKDNLKKTVRSLANALDGPRGELLQNILGLAQSNAELRSAFLLHWIGPRREMGELALRDAVERGELQKDTNLGLLLDMIYGAVYYRLTVSFSTIDASFVDQVVDRAFSHLLVK